MVKIQIRSDVFPIHLGAVMPILVGKAYNIIPGLIGFPLLDSEIFTEGKCHPRIFSVAAGFCYNAGHRESGVMAANIESTATIVIVHPAHGG